MSLPEQTVDGQEQRRAATLAVKPGLREAKDAAQMLDVLAAPGAALALALLLVFSAGTAAWLRCRQDPSRCAELAIVVLVLTLTMAVGIVIFQPPQAGDLTEEEATQ